MNTRKILGISLMVLLLFLCAVLMILRLGAAKASDAAALEASMATPEPTATPDATPEPTSTPEPTPTPEPTATPAPTLDPNSPAGRAAALGLPEPPDIDINSWEYILANADNSIAEYTPPELVTLEGQLVDSRIADALAAMAADTRAQGLSVYLSSGYRSYAEQEANFIRVCRNNGVSDGKDSKGFYITMPAGCSEHQTGLCCDITDIYYPTKNRSLENTAMYQYMSQHCQEFGFIVRFPDGMESITGVMYEPFHFRYVGVEAAEYITANNICFETFVSLYRDINTAENPPES